MQNIVNNTSHDYYTVEHVRLTVLENVFPVLCFFGITGICITIFVLSRKHMITSTNCHLVALSVADLCFLVLLVILEAIKPDYSNGYTEREHFSYLMFAETVLIFMFASVWLTVILAVERYVAICRPFIAAKLCTVRNSVFFIGLIYVVAVLVRLPAFLENRIEFIKHKNGTIYTISPYLTLNKNYQVIYNWIVNIAMTSILPFIMLFFLNVRLIWEIRKSTRYVQKNMFIEKSDQSRKHLQREEFQVTVMLISIVMVFFVCQAPYVIFISIFASNDGEHIEVFQVIAKVSGANVVSLLVYISQLLLTLKSAVNFIVYCWFSEKFWNTLKALAISRFVLKQVDRLCPSLGNRGRRRRSSCGAGAAVGGVNYSNAATSRDTIASNYAHLAGSNGGVMHDGRADTML